MRKITFKRYLVLPVFVVALLLAKSCDLYDFEYLETSGKIEDYNYQADFAIALVNSELNVEDIVEPDTIDLVEVDADNLVWLVYSTEEIYTKTAGEVYSIDDQNNSFSTQISATKSNISETFSRTFIFQNDGNERIDSITFLQAIFNVGVEAPEAVADGFDIEVNYRVIGSSLQSTGEELQRSFLLSNQSDQVDLASYLLTFENEGNENYFTIEYELTLTGSGTPTHSEYTVHFDQSLRNIQFDTFYGNVGSFSFSLGRGNLKIGIFDDTNAGSIYFNNPMVDVVVTNFFGVDIEMQLDAEFLVDNETDSVHLEIYADEYNPWVVSSSGILGDSAVSVASLNKQNTNVFDIVAQRPTRLSYSATSITNPDNDPDAHNFVRHDSKLQYNLNFDLPLDLRVEMIEMENTFQLELNEIEISEEIDSLLLNIIIENEFPINGLAEIYFLNEAGDTLTTLFENPELESLFAAAPAEGEFSTTQIQVELDSEKADKVFQSSEVLIKSRFDTYQSQQEDSYVKIYDYYNVRIKMGALVSVNTTIEL